MDRGEPSTAHRFSPGGDGEGGLDLVLVRSAVDRRFRSRLLEDPHRAIAEELQIVLSPRFRIRFVEKDPGVTLMIVLPDMVEGSPHDRT